MRWTAAAVVALVGLCAYGQAESAPRIALMPQPRQMTAGAGELAIGPGFAVRVEAPAGDRLP